MTLAITESESEEVALEILSNLGYSTIDGPDIIPTAIIRYRATD